MLIDSRVSGMIPAELIPAPASLVDGDARAVDDADDGFESNGHVRVDESFHQQQQHAQPQRCGCSCAAGRAGLGVCHLQQLPRRVGSRLRGEGGGGTSKMTQIRGAAPP